MSEFKFACPVCGQHITADSTTSGSHTDCPTCFRSLVVPQAPASNDLKLIVSATLAPKTRLTAHASPGSYAARSNGRTRFRLQGIGLGVLLCVTAAALYLFREQIFKTPPHEHEPAPPQPAVTPWTLNLSEAVLQEGAVSGRIHGREFRCDEATLQGGRLTLAQGHSWPPELGISISFYVQEFEKLSGKSLEVAPDRAPPLPKVVLRWKNEQDQGVNQTIHSGYALKLAFGHPLEGRMAGTLFIALPDSEKSFVSGTFEAVLRKAPVRSQPEGAASPEKARRAPR